MESSGKTPQKLEYTVLMTLKYQISPKCTKIHSNVAKFTVVIMVILDLHFSTPLGAKIKFKNMASKLCYGRFTTEIVM